jgi:outer membrane protein assembly factor BamD
MSFCLSSRDSSSPVQVSSNARAMPVPVAVAVLLALGLLSSCIHKKYDTPITKNTQQPDKVLFDQAIKDIEHGRYEVARISLQTLMNTYESSEFMAKSKLAVADSWYREGGANGLAQAEAEYKDFILFYPSMEESAEAQNRVCQIHYKQMEKSDRDWSQTLRAEDECRQLLVQYPNSKFAPQTAQLVRNIQESLAEHEFVVGNFYWRRDMNPAAANRLGALVNQYPLYSKAGESLYEAGDSYTKMGPRVRKEAGDMFARVVREYPLSNRAEEAKKRLEEMELPVPSVDQAAYDREKHEQENYRRPGMMARSTSWLRGNPDLSRAAKSGAPTMTDPKATIPASVPVANNTDEGSGSGGGSGSMEVTATPAGANSALDKNPDARSSAGTAQASTAAAAQQPLPTNRDRDLKKMREMQAKKQAKLDKKKKKKDQPPTAAQTQQGQSQLNQSLATQGAQTPTGTPNATTPAATNATQQPPTGQTPQR